MYEPLLFSGLSWPGARVVQRGPIPVVSDPIFVLEGKLEWLDALVVNTGGKGRAYQVEHAEGWWRVTPSDVAVCVDFGSTFTKASLVDLDTGRIVAAAEHPTTIETDVLDGYDACLAELVRQDPRAATAEVLACSSAGGGLRIAVIGNEELVTAEAGRRVALSSGGKVVSVVAAAGRC